MQKCIPSQFPCPFLKTQFFADVKYTINIRNNNKYYFFSFVFQLYTHIYSYPKKEVLDSLQLNVNKPTRPLHLMNRNLNLFKILITICFAFFAVKGEETEIKIKKLEKFAIFDSCPVSPLTPNCSRKLEAILYSPPSTVQKYLAEIAAKMRIDIKKIMASFAAGNLGILRSYITNYHILITINDSIGKPVLVASDFSAYTDPIQNVAQALSYTNSDGFYADSSRGFYNYQFNVMSNYGVFVSFILSLPLSAMTNVPISCN